MDTSDSIQKVCPCKLDFNARRRNLTSEGVGAGASQIEEIKWFRLMVDRPLHQLTKNETVQLPIEGFRCAFRHQILFFSMLI